MKDEDQQTVEPTHATIMLLTITATNEIRSQLSTNEEGYFLFRKLLSLVSVRDRAHYLYSVLDELERVGLALLRAKEMFDETDSPNSDDLEGQRLCRNLNASIQSELALYIRKLTELLVELINFSVTNKNVYFNHYLIYKDLSLFKKRQADLQNFLGIKNLNMGHRIGFLQKTIKEFEKQIDLTKCWYLQGKNPPPGGTAKMSSFEARFKKALPIASKGERAAFGMYYEQAFRIPSRDMHLNIADRESDESVESIRAQRVRIVALLLHSLHRCYRLLGIEPTSGVLADMVKPHIDSCIAGDAEIFIGDEVMVLGLKSQVIDCKESKYGYKSYKIRYSDEAPVKGVDDEDWFPALQVNKIPQ